LPEAFPIKPSDNPSRTLIFTVALKFSHRYDITLSFAFVQRDGLGVPVAGSEMTAPKLSTPICIFGSNIHDCDGSLASVDPRAMRLIWAITAANFVSASRLICCWA
jgi:hypothetical protein